MPVEDWSDCHNGNVTTYLDMVGIKCVCSVPNQLSNVIGQGV